MYFVYVLYSKIIKQFYTGSTSDIYKRLRHHNLGLDRWSKRGVPWEIVYSKAYLTKSEALREEKYLKSGVGRKFVHAEVAKAVTARV